MDCSLFKLDGIGEAIYIEEARRQSHKKQESRSSLNLKRFFQKMVEELPHLY